MDIDTGGGEVIKEAPVLPPVMVVTESWPPNAERARVTLRSRGVRVLETRDGSPLPLDDAAFDLVTTRHHVRPDWHETHGVLRPAGHYSALHVGARCRLEFFDVGAVVWILRKCVWWVPDFTVTRYEHQLPELDAKMRHGEPFVAHSSRHLIEARK